MKKNIHPEMFPTKFSCSCGNILDTFSTKKGGEIRIEICSACHPFYTGEQRILKTGAVDKFYARQKKTDAFKK